MAIYHFSGTIISRSQGRSAIACAAYRSAERLHDERIDKNHDYTHKQDVVFTEILLPAHAPNWMLNREKLWNSVEANEKRKDAQLAREFNFALPRELTLEQNILLAKEFVTQEFVSKGMVVDLCIHNDKMPDGQLQPHAHVMLTLREVTPSGFGKKVREWNAKENLFSWREAWASIANRHLLLHGHDVKIDHRSLKEQGIDLEPQHKIGAAVAKERLARLEDHQRIARENGEKLLADPLIALSAITRQQSTFTHQDLARFVNRHTVDMQQFQCVYEKVKACDQLVYLGIDDRKRERFTTQEMLAIETQMLTHANTLSLCARHGVIETIKATALATRHLASEQRLAFEYLTQAGDLKCVVGYAGTGKSYLLGAAREAWEMQGYRVLGATLSGIASENLTGSSCIESRTLASHFYYWDRGEQLLTSNAILVIDEAGMIGSRQMAQLLAQAEQYRAKVVLIGDPEQLQAIEAGAAFRAISERTGYVELTDIWRQREDWQREATRELATGKTALAILRYHQHHHVHAFETEASAQQGLISLWNDVRLNEPSKTQIMLAYTRQAVRELNDSARNLRHQQGELGQEYMVVTARGERSLAEHDRIYFLKNNRNLGVMNGTLGTVAAIQGKQITVRLDLLSELQLDKVPRIVTFHLDAYNHIDHGYAATIHKAQGVTVDRSYLLASKYLDRHATYVAVTRHRESTDIFYSHETFASERALVTTLSRERTKDMTLDYQDDQKVFTQSRSIEKPIQPFDQYDPYLSPASSLVEKSLEQNQALRYEQFLQQAAKDYDRMSERQVHSSNDFSRFKAEFEAQHPEQAKALQDRVRPRHERLALEAEKQIQQLEKEMAQSRMPSPLRKQLEKYATDISKQKEVMNYLKQHRPALSQKIQGLVKSYALSHERDQGGRSL